MRGGERVGTIVVLPDRFQLGTARHVAHPRGAPPATGNEPSAGLEELEPGLRSKSEPAVTCRSCVLCRFAALERGPDVAEVAHRGPDGARVALDDEHAEPAGTGLNGVREADDARADDRYVEPVFQNLRLPAYL